MKWDKKIAVIVLGTFMLVMANCLPTFAPPIQLNVISTLTTGGRSQRLAIKDHFLFVADRKGGIKVIDISNVEKPQLKTQCGTEDVGSILVHGDVLYAGTFSPPYKLLVYDIRDPMRPIRIKEVNMLGPILGLTAWGAYCYISEGGLFAIEVLDISNPANPKILNQIEGSSNSLLAYGGYVFAAEDTTFSVYDVSNPASPRLIGSCKIIGGPQDIVLAYKYAYVAALDGLHVIDLSDITHPREVSYQKLKKPAYAITATKDHIFIANYDEGLAVFDISGNKAKPRYLKNITLPGLTFDVIFSSGVIYTANESAGIAILK